MNPDELRVLIGQGESLTVEFKSGRGPLSDGDLVDAVVCLTNARGGILLVGVEDDGEVTGLHPRHQTHPAICRRIESPARNSAHKLRIRSL